tara:strand:- start:323 stop:595 length:273 start_codon:yes stop_codon:yes gene_type:complete
MEQTQQTTVTGNNKPAKSYRIGRWQISQWKNTKMIEGQQRELVSYSLRRSWKAKDKDAWNEDSIKNINTNEFGQIMALIDKIMAQEIKES